MNLEDELGRLFSDERLDLPVRPDAEKILARGIGRRRRRRAAATMTAGAFAIAGVLGLSVALPAVRGGDQTLAGTRLPVATSPVSTGQPALPDSSSQVTSPAPSSTTTTVPPSATKKPSASTGASGKPSSRASSSAPPPSTSKVIGPDGWGRLRLGMSEAQAVATGEFDPAEPASGSPCHRYWLAGSSGPVDISPDHGVSMISPGGAVQTPEGVGVGSTDAQVRAAYPNATFADYEFTVPVPGNSAAVYIMNTDPSEKIFSVRLQLLNSDC